MIEVAILKWSLLNIKKQKWRNLDIIKSEKINADNEYDEKKLVESVAMKCCVYFNKTKKEMSREIAI